MEISFCPSFHSTMTRFSFVSNNIMDSHGHVDFGAPVYLLTAAINSLSYITAVVLRKLLTAAVVNIRCSVYGGDLLPLLVYPVSCENLSMERFWFCVLNFCASLCY